MSQHRNPEAKTLRISVLHAQGRHLDAEWERLELEGARSDATDEDLMSHRLTFFLGALSIWQAMQDAEDETVVQQLQSELEAFLAEMESMGYIRSSGSGAEGRSWRSVH